MLDYCEWLFSRESPYLVVRVLVPPCTDRVASGKNVGTVVRSLWEGQSVERSRHFVYLEVLWYHRSA